MARDVLNPNKLSDYSEEVLQEVLKNDGYKPSKYVVLNNYLSKFVDTTFLDCSMTLGVYSLLICAGVASSGQKLHIDLIYVFPLITSVAYIYFRVSPLKYSDKLECCNMLMSYIRYKYK